ncbi:hypothetical protein DICSQDRAFT_171518 [Dichomitus squalens LYAD-421 SS1]|uniref:DUF6697 domain-containing protein n=2 Tax=Dichomitus squalens TaxID=114155 RepID=R7SVD4_DICSQ|nr:uncharacterized protein DICSQDRAFT_171518 [Dichomitus squalens LYAD-421 SS1]EJF60031.1 hypothetical protein DICSQDRAFT_171518 [Dichomitus squalens LYAD-421 SS1]
MSLPKFKVKEEMLLSDEFLLDALTWEGLNHRYPVPLPEGVAEFGLSRKYICSLYGGCRRGTFIKPGDEWLGWHGLDDWVYLTMEFAPHAPTKPGRSGLFFACNRATETWPPEINKPRRLFVRLAHSQWVYMGQYRMAPGLSLTADAWKQQKDQVRRTWTRSILHKQWGFQNLARIWIRKEKGVD